MSSNYIIVHGHKGIFTEDIHAEVQIQLHCSSLNTKIIYGQVQLKQACPKQTGV